jgi:hypothetical protein
MAAANLLRLVGSSCSNMNRLQLNGYAEMSNLARTNGGALLQRVEKLLCEPPLSAVSLDHTRGAALGPFGEDHTRDENRALFVIARQSWIEFPSDACGSGHCNSRGLGSCLPVQP